MGDRYGSKPLIWDLIEYDFRKAFYQVRCLNKMRLYGQMLDYECRREGPASPQAAKLRRLIIMWAEAYRMAK